MAYNDEVLADSPVRYWRLEDTTGASSVNTGAITKPASASVVTGRVGNGWSFNGTDGAPYTWPLTGVRTTFTIELWIKGNNSKANQYLAYKINGTSKFQVFLHGSASATPGRIDTSVVTSTGNTSTATHANSYNDNNWHHVVVTYTGNTVRLYVDGSLRTTGNTVTGNPDFGTGNGYVGNYTDIQSTFGFVGIIDEYAIYTAALSGTDIQGHYDYLTSVSVSPAVTAQTATATVVEPNIVVTSEPLNAYASVTPATATADIVESVVSAGTSVTVSPLTATSTSVDGAVATDSNVSLVQPPLTATALSPMALTSLSNIVDFDTNYPTAGVQPSDWTEAGYTDADWLITTVNSIRRLVINTGGNGNAYFLRNGISASDTDVVAKMLTYTTGAGATRGPGVTASFTSSAVNYHAEVRSNGNLVLLRNGVSVGTVAHGLTVTNYFWVRLRVSGTSVRVRTWAATGSEPSTWNIDYTDSSPLAAGKAGLFAGAEGNRYDYFAVATNGITAPIPSGDVVVSAVPVTASTVDTDFVVRIGNTVSVTATTATATLGTVSVAAGRNVLVGVPAVTATALTVMAVFPHVTYVVEPAEASATSPTPNIIGGQGVTAAVSAATADAAAVDATFMNDTDVQIVLSAVGAYAEVIDPYKVDPLPVALDQSTNDDDLWMALTDTNTNAIAIKGSDGTWANTPTLVAAIGDREAVNFDGSQTLTLHQYNTSFGAVTTGQWELLIRTTKADQIIAFGNVESLFTRLSMTGGRLVVAVAGATHSPSKVINDGQWHHIVLTIDPTSDIQVHIDGQLALRRTNTTNSYSMSPPEVVGTLTGYAAFEGDLGLLVYRAGHAISAKTIQRHWYYVQGYEPVYTSATTASATLVDAKVRGNQKRALALYGAGMNMWVATTAPGGDTYPWSGIVGNEVIDTAGNRLGYVNTQGQYVKLANSFEWMDHKVYLEPYRQGIDDITGEPRYINFQTDVDLTDYDLVFFIDQPNPNYTHQDWTNNPYESRRRYDEMLTSLRTALDASGTSFWCPQPQIAYDMGFIGGVSTHSLMRENMYDYRSFQIEPKVKTHSGPGWYSDTHYLNKYRIVGTEPDLTDLGGYIIDDTAHWFDQFDDFAAHSETIRYNVKNVQAGLQIGDEVYFPSKLYVERTGNANLPYSQRKTVVGVPDTTWHVGTAIAKEQASVWTGQVELPNPYADWTLAFIIKPGDTVKGRPMASKVYVDFMSGYYAQTKAAQIAVQDFPQVPAHPDYLAGWSYDTRRQDEFTTTLAISEKGYSETGMPIVRIKRAEFPVTEVYERYDIEWRETWDLLSRAVNWLGVKEVTEPGAKRVHVSPVTATADVVAAAAGAQRNTSVSVPPLQALVSLVQSPSINAPDVSISLLPASATATVVSLQKTVKVGVATASATVVEGPTIVNVGGQRVVVYLHSYSPTLYLKEAT